MFMQYDHVEFGPCLSIFSAYYAPVRKYVKPFDMLKVHKFLTSSVFFLQYFPRSFLTRNFYPQCTTSHLMDLDMEFRTSSNGADSEEIVE